MGKLSGIYGYCIVPKNTFLFRGHKDISFNDCMFFATKHWAAISFNDTIQIWKTTTEIEILFLVEYLNDESYAISALPRLYNSIFPPEANFNFSDRDIKFGDLKRRDKFIRQLYDNFNIYGWLTSIEGKVEIELCLFDKQANSKQIVLVDTVNQDNKSYFKDSLARIKIFPSDSFYIQTSAELRKHGSILTDEKENYKSYKKSVKTNIEFYVGDGMTPIEAKHHMFDLRTKLKI